MGYENEMEINPVPEIQRTNLTNVVLMMKSFGIDDIVRFDFLDPPPSEALIKSLEQLYALGALNKKGNLTKLGRRMAEFPVDPQLSKMLLVSEQYKVSHEAATIAAMMSCGKAIFFRPKERQIQADSAHKNFEGTQESDHIVLMTIFNEWENTKFSSQFCYENFIQIRTMKNARDIREQLVELMERVEIEINSNAFDNDNICKCISAGYFNNVARLQKNGSYQTIKNHKIVSIHPSSYLHQRFPRYVVFHELILTKKEYMRLVSAIKPEWLMEVAPHMFKGEDIDSRK